MEKSNELNAYVERNISNVTPSAPPTYDEAVGGGNYPPSTGLYPAVPFHSVQGPTYPYPVVQPPSAIPDAVVTGRSYPIQEGVPVTIQPQPIRCMLPVGPKSLKATCPSCQKSMSTRTDTKNVIIKYVCCLLLIGSVVCCPCACLPFCLCPSAKVDHFCPACNAYLGTYQHH